MEKIQVRDNSAHATVWRVARCAMVVLGAIAAAILVITCVSLLSGIKGPECHGEFPICTTPSQEAARKSIAMLCGLGAFAYLLAALPALKAEQFNWLHVVIGLIMVLVVLALVTNPASHLRSEVGSDQWFVTSWPSWPP